MSTGVGAKQAHSRASFCQVLPRGLPPEAVAQIRVGLPASIESAQKIARKDTQQLGFGWFYMRLTTKISHREDC